MRRRLAMATAIVPSRLVDRVPLSVKLIAGHTVWSNPCPAREEEKERVEHAKQNRDIYWHVLYKASITRSCAIALPITIPFERSPNRRSPTQVQLHRPK